MDYFHGKNKRMQNNNMLLTKCGRDYTEVTIPKLIKSIDKLTSQLEISNLFNECKNNSDKTSEKIKIELKKNFLKTMNDISSVVVSENFYLTRDGNHYFNYQLPQLIKNIENLTKEIKKNNELLENKKNTSI